MLRKNIIHVKLAWVLIIEPGDANLDNSKAPILCPQTEVYLKGPGGTRIQRV